MTPTTEPTIPPKLQVLVDANLLVAGIGWPRFPCEVLQHAFVGDFQLLLTERIILEARAAAQRVIPKRAENLTIFLNEVDYVTLPTASNEQIMANAALCRDAKDVPCCSRCKRQSGRNAYFAR